jgi:hypothetical protein
MRPKQPPGICRLLRKSSHLHRKGALWAPSAFQETRHD